MFEQFNMKLTWTFIVNFVYNNLYTLARYAFLIIIKDKYQFIHNYENVEWLGKMMHMHKRRLISSSYIIHVNKN